MLRHLVEYLDSDIIHLAERFYTESNKIRDIPRTVSFKRSTNAPLKNISTAQFSFNQIVMPLKEKIQLESEIVTTGGPSKKDNVQLITYPKDVRKYDKQRTCSHDRDNNQLVHYIVSHVHFGRDEHNRSQS